MNTRTHSTHLSSLLTHQAVSAVPPLPIEVGQVTVFVPPGTTVSQGTVPQSDVVVWVNGGPGSALVVGHGIAWHHQHKWAIKNPAFLAEAATRLRNKLLHRVSYLAAFEFLLLPSPPCWKKFNKIPKIDSYSSTVHVVSAVACVETASHLLRVCICLASKHIRILSYSQTTFCIRLLSVPNWRYVFWNKYPTCRWCAFAVMGVKVKTCISIPVLSSVLYCYSLRKVSRETQALQVAHVVLCSLANAYSTCCPPVFADGEFELLLDWCDLKFVIYSVSSLWAQAQVKPQLILSRSIGEFIYLAQTWGNGQREKEREQLLSYCPWARVASVGRKPWKVLSAHQSRIHQSCHRSLRCIVSNVSWSPACHWCDVGASERREGTGLMATM